MKRYIIGIDEVGRGSLAGPVTVVALALPLKLNIKNQILKIPRNKKFSLKLRDSKKLSPSQREIWFNIIKKQPEIFYATANVSPKVIDKINISQAANLAATRALKALIKNEPSGDSPTAKTGLRIKNCRIFLDGGLKINKDIADSLAASGHKLKTIIRGDEKISAISLASIAAKVVRDRYMKKIHKKHPRYDFINNVGYGTAKHIKALKKFGRSPIHRKSFKT